MVVVHLENVKAKLNDILSQMNTALLSGKEVEVKPNVFMKLNGPLDFTIKSVNQGIEIKFKLQPQVRVQKLFNFYGDLEKVLITKQGIYLTIAGLPDVFMEAVS